MFKKAALVAGVTGVAIVGAIVAPSTASAATHAPTKASCSTDAECAYAYAAPVGYRYVVSTSPGGYRFKALPTEDSAKAGVWNAATRGNRQGASFVHLSHGDRTVYLGVNDHRQGDTAPASDGLVAWERHHPVRVTTLHVWKRYGWVSRTLSKVQVLRKHGGWAKARVLYVQAMAIWPAGCYC